MLEVARRPGIETRPPPRPVVRRLAAYRARPTGEDLTAWIGMVVFLGSWAMLFAGLFFAYGRVRSHAPLWPAPGEPRLPLLLPGVATAVIAASSAAVAAARRAPRSPGRGAALALAAALGTLFLSLQVVVWVRLWGEGLVPSGGPYPSVFYGLTALHAAHVLVGLLALAWLAARALSGGASSLAVRLWGMYWHFVGAVWLLLYLAVYVL